ncbi:MAG: hypothetical protein K9W44_09535 [Candidatus Lokiarchaeota archaeon]|nr:hypothetical protein [Candidatus Harpocratesius repetitus]
MNENQIEIFFLLLTKNSLTISEIQEETSQSYSQTVVNLKYLQKLGLLTVENCKPKKVHLFDPKISIQQLIEKKNEYFQQNLEKIEREIKIQTSHFGVCAKEISHYYYSDIGLGIERWFRLIYNAEKSIVLSSLPLKIYKRIEPALKHAFQKGIQIQIYYSRLDFNFENQEMEVLEKIMDILQNLRFNLIELEEKTCQNVGFNNQIIQNGFLLIDNIFFNSLGFLDEKVFYIHGFYSKNTVEQITRLFQLKTPKKHIELKYPKVYSKIIQIIQTNQNPIKTRDLSRIIGIGGTKLKQMLDFLVREGEIQKKIVSSTRGRPAVYYFY